MIKVKTFLEALSWVKKDIKVLPKYYNDKRMSVTEKTILKSWMLLRDTKCQEIINLLTPLQHTDKVVMAQKHLLLGVAYNNKSEFHKAIKHIEEAIELMKGLELSDYNFTAYSNLFIANLNLKNKKGLTHSLKMLKEIKTNDPNQIINLMQAQFKYYAFTENYAEAQICMEEISEHEPQMNERQILSFLIAQFNFYIKTDNFSDAKATLHKMKKYRKFNYKAVFQYMRILLDHYINNSTIYITDSEFKDYPALFYMIKTVQLLAESQVEEAKGFWQKLGAVEPEVYLPNFNYQGDKCLFSICLEKHQAKTQSLAKLETLDLPDVKEKALIEMLQIASAPIRKDEIYFKLWGEKPLDKSDLGKLEKLVSRARKKHNAEIKTLKGCYFLAENLSKKAS